MAKYAVFVNLKGVIYVDANSKEDAELKATYSGNNEVSWDEWFSIDNAQIEEE